jgi:hypothetical protein
VSPTPGKEAPRPTSALPIPRHSPDLPAPRRPRMARLTSRGALCRPLPARGFPNTEAMAQRGGHGPDRPSAASCVPAVGAWRAHAPHPRVSAPGRAQRRRCGPAAPRGGGAQPAGGRGAPAPAPFKGCRAPLRTPTRRESRAGPRHAPFLPSAPKPGREGPETGRPGIAGREEGGVQLCPNRGWGASHQQEHPPLSLFCQTAPPPPPGSHPVGLRVLPFRPGPAQGCFSNPVLWWYHCRNQAPGKRGRVSLAMTSWVQPHQT